MFREVDFSSSAEKRNFQISDCFVTTHTMSLRRSMLQRDDGARRLSQVEDIGKIQRKNAPINSHSRHE